MKIRHPAVAGRFYPGTRSEISVQLSNILRKEQPFIEKSLSEKKIIGGVVPHAGYMFSAYQAMHFFEILKNSAQQFDTFVIINPNHTGYGAEIALDENDAWETPYGKVEIDREFYELLDFPASASAHKYEHSGEVMLPMLQHSLNYPFKIAPVTLSRQNPENAAILAKSLFEASKELDRDICVIASSDFSHYVEPGEGKKLDGFVIDRILAQDIEGVYREVMDKNISICGYGPIMTLMEFAKKASDSLQVKILKIGHSGEVMPSDEVVDYVSILFYED
jgi:AmmeMemoRadiSam system protein B